MDKGIRRPLLIESDVNALYTKAESFSSFHYNERLFIGRVLAVYWKTILIVIPNMVMKT